MPQFVIPVLHLADADSLAAAEDLAAAMQRATGTGGRVGPPVEMRTRPPSPAAGATSAADTLAAAVVMALADPLADVLAMAIAADAARTATAGDPAQPGATTPTDPHVGAVARVEAIAAAHGGVTAFASRDGYQWQPEPAHLSLVPRDGDIAAILHIGAQIIVIPRWRAFLAAAAPSGEARGDDDTATPADAPPRPPQARALSLGKIITHRAGQVRRGPVSQRRAQQVAEERAAHTRDDATQGETGEP